MANTAPNLRDARVDIDGITFAGVDVDGMTFEHHIYLEELLVSAGLHDPGALMSREALPQANAKSLVLALYRSDRTFDWLAGVLVEEGKPWSKSAAAANAQRFARATSKSSIKAMQGLVAESLIGFFVAGLASFGTSPSSIPDPATPEEASGSDQPTSSSAVSSDSGNGLPSSADSPSTTGTA